MQGAAFADMKQKTTLRQRLLLIFGIAAICAGLGILGFFGGRKVFRMIKKQKLLSENVVLEIPALKIKAPVLEGTDNEILAKAVGHFPGTGAPGSGNYCLAGHSSTLYKEYFNRKQNPLRRGTAEGIAVPNSQTTVGLIKRTNKFKVPKLI